MTELGGAETGDYLAPTAGIHSSPSPPDLQSLSGFHGEARKVFRTSCFHLSVLTVAESSSKEKMRKVDSCSSTCHVIL